MTDTFLIHIERNEGALQRLIGLIERRGFHIDRMNVADAGAHQEVDGEAEVDEVSRVQSPRRLAAGTSRPA